MLEELEAETGRPAGSLSARGKASLAALRGPGESWDKRAAGFLGRPGPRSYPARGLAVEL